MESDIYSNPLDLITQNGEKNNRKSSVKIQSSLKSQEASGEDGSGKKLGSNKESNSNMQFRPIVVTSPGIKNEAECIYAVVHKSEKDDANESKTVTSANDVSTNNSVARTVTNNSQDVHYSSIGIAKNKDEPQSNNVGNSHYLPVPSSPGHYETLPDIDDPIETVDEKTEKKKQPLKYSSSSSSSSSSSTLASTIPPSSSFSSSSSSYCNINNLNSTNKINNEIESYNFSAVFLGSMVVDIPKMQANKSEYISECIQLVAGQTSGDATKTLLKLKNKKQVNSVNGNKKEESENDVSSVGSVTLSKHRGMNVTLELKESGLKLFESRNKKERMDIPLRLIRLWGVGRGTNSREFAIISRDLPVSNTLCRVFLCEDFARKIAETFQAVCSRVAEKTKTLKNSKESSPVRKIPFSGNLTRNENNTIRSNRSDGCAPPPALHASDNETYCIYLGMMEVTKPTGTKILEHAIDMVRTYVDEKNWLRGKIQLTFDGVYFITSKSVRLSCPNESISFAGISIKHKQLAGFIVSKNNGTFVHVFSIEADYISWFENVKFICKLHSSKYDKSIFTTLNKKRK
ncbi:hypothetical protein HELRODRAFT_194585 [Helobdella robusta]|uniref:PID domain-containing protein n=1 Tax=Helobdella robusta TaxID=6412 RepID=T1FW81_HELRO|nr:hypothetical protein HELRODRAFT_194585 [Helobdella robusta]ESN91034.1 hypothetical protein HELRODRAFT_194585 [Helobdella robusta]